LNKKDLNVTCEFLVVDICQNVSGWRKVKPTRVLYTVFMQMFLELTDSESGLIRNLTGWRQVLNIGDPRYRGVPAAYYDNYRDFVAQPRIRGAIHVAGAQLNNGSAVSAHLALDYLQSARPQLETILDNGYKVR
jgi:hypothetical protein